MHSDSLYGRVRAFASRLWEPGAEILAAVSGGSDSVAMVHLLHDLRSRLGIVRLGVAHVNHGLRPGPCDREEEFVRKLARSLGVDFHSVRLSGRSLSDSGIESWARTERYRFFHDICRRYGYRMVATGHTLDDQAETVLLRLSRGCGLVGLAGIHARRADNVVRPVLCATRRELRQYLAQRGIDFCEDFSNADDRFARNRIRHHILPALEEALPGTTQRLANLAETVQSLQHLVYPLINKWITQNVVHEGVGRIEIRRDAVAAGNWEACEGLAEILRRNGIAVTRCHVEAMVRLGARGTGAWKLPGGWSVTADENSLVLTQGENFQETQPEFEYELQVPGTTVCGERAVFHIAVIEGRGDKNAVSQDNLSVMLDYADTSDRLVFRNWRPDDKFWPLGGTREMRVHDFLKSQGLVFAERCRVGVVATPEGEIVWIPGLRVGERRRVGPQSTRVLEAQCTWLQKVRDVF